MNDKPEVTLYSNSNSCTAKRSQFVICANPTNLPWEFSSRAYAKTWYKTQGRKLDLRSSETRNRRKFTITSQYGGNIYIVDVPKGHVVCTPLMAYEDMRKDFPVIGGAALVRYGSIR